jgi:beta propeller repeat protein
MKRCIVFFLASVAIMGCGACSGGKNGDIQDADAFQDAPPESTEEGDAEDLPGESDAFDGQDTHDRDSGDAESGDPVTDNDYLADLVGCRDIVSFMLSRPPTECGESCRQVSFLEDDVWSSALDVWGDYLAINTLGGSAAEGHRKGVYLVDLNTLTYYLVLETVVYEVPAPAIDYVAIFNESVVYGYKSEDYQKHLMHIDIPSHCQDVLYDSGSYSSALLDSQMYGDYVSWWDNRSGEGGDGRVYLFDMLSRTEREITTEPFFVVGGIDMQGGRVVFTSDNGGNDWPHVFVHDIDSGVTEKITTGNWAYMYPAVWGDIVVWTDMRRGGDYVDQGMADIYMYDLSTGIESAVCDNPASQVHGTIYENIVAWSDFRNDPEYPNTPTRATMDDIYIRDLTGGEERLIPSVAKKKGVREVRGNKIYFLMIDDAGVESVFEVTF